MKQKKIIISIFIIVSLLTSSLSLCGKTQIVEGKKKNSQVELKATGELKYSQVFDVLSLVNKKRKARGLSPLVMDKDLLEAAMQRAAENALSFSHIRPNGKGSLTINKNVWAENIATGTSSVKTVMNVWMKSGAHRNNILGNFKSIGIGCFYHNGETYWVQCFGGRVREKASETANIRKQVTIRAKSSNIKIKIGTAKTSIKVGKKKRLNVYAFTKESGKCLKLDRESIKWKVSKKKKLSCKNGIVMGLAVGNAKVKAKVGNLSAKAKIRIRGYKNKIKRR